MSAYDDKVRLLSLKQWDADAVRELASLSNFNSWTFEPQATFEAGVLGELTRPRQWRFLAIHDSELERGNLRALANLSSLQRLDLKSCRFDSEDFTWLCEQLAAGACPKLTEFWLDGTPVGDEELQALGKIERLRMLDLGDTHVSDIGLDHLHGLEKLEILYLRHTRVSDVGIMRLAVLPRLYSVAPSNVETVKEVGEHLFLAQLALKKSKKSPDPVQLDKAGGRMHAFLGEMESWERAANLNASRIKERHNAERLLPNPISDTQRQEWTQFLDDLKAQKAALTARYYSKRLAAESGQSIGFSNPPRFRQVVDWLDAETPSKKKTIFYCSDERAIRRHTLILEDGEWKLDDVRRWTGGWKRDIV